MDEHISFREIAAQRALPAARMRSLYSNFDRLKPSNIEGYVANIDDWRALLSASLTQGLFPNRTVLTVSSKFPLVFASEEFGVPIALHCVLDEMLAEGELVPLAAFNASCKSEQASSEQQGAAQPGLAWRAASYIFSAARIAAGAAFGRSRAAPSALPSGELKQETYVWVAKVEAAADELYNAVKQSSDAMVSAISFDELEQVLKQTGCSNLSKLDRELCLNFCRKRGLLNVDSAHSVLKLSSLGPLSNVDFGIVQLKRHARQAESRFNEHSERSKQLYDEAREALKRGDRSRARRVLARRSTSEKAAQSAEADVIRVETLLQQIDAAQTNKQALAVMQTGAALLKQANAGIQLDELDELTDSLAADAELTEEVSARLGSLQISPESEADIDEELNALERDARKEEEATESKLKEDLIAKMPSAPGKLPAKQSDATTNTTTTGSKAKQQLPAN